MNNRSFRLSPRRLSQQQQQQQPLLSSNTNGGNSSSGWIKTSESHEFFLTDPVPLPPVLTPQAEESFRFMDRNVRENRSFKTSSNTNNSTRRLLSKMFLRKQAAKNSSDSYSYSYSTISSTTHSPLQSKATAAAAGLQVPGSSRFNINNDNHNSSNSSKTHSHSHSHTNSTTLDLSRDATRVLRRSKHMQMSRQQSAPDLVGSVLVLSKRIVNSDAATSTIAAAAATIADTAEKGYQQHGLNNGIGEDEDQTADVPLHNNAPSPRRASCVAATTTTTTTSPRRRGLQLQPRKWQQFSQSFLTGTPLSPSSVTATTEMTANAIEKTTLTRNDDSCHCEPGLVCMAAADDNDNNKNENMHQTDPSLSPFSPTSTRRLLSFDGLVESFDGLVEKASVSSLQQQPSVEMACSGALDDEVEDKETPVQHSSVSTDRDSPWRCVPCFFCTNTLYCADDADDADDYLLFCSECHGASPVRVDGVVVTPTQTPSTC
jgi:hypothetical protein